ncbi:hypothetical protein [Glaciihabitans sp. GrIS 2.15]|uniref:hypothetical protein n=1 Tax=Glaciihabitans sp. GrIS 2.15 TaxID=3071710 RepID=UPI001991EBD4|nr:hypothetical protein [Microbacteriaceae bacterium]
MALSRKRAKELKRLRAAASDLWEDQREVLEHASLVVKEAGRQAANAGREEVAPRVRETYDHRVRPVVDLGVASGRAVADTAREKVQRDVLPAVSSALAAALAVFEVSKDPRVREALSNVRKAGNQLGAKVGVVPPKPQPGPGRYILIALAAVAAVGVAYAAWQTLRADDELWVSDDETDDPIAPSSSRA